MEESVIPDDTRVSRTRTRALFARARTSPPVQKISERNSSSATGIVGVIQACRRRSIQQKAELPFSPLARLSIHSVREQIDDDLPFESGRSAPENEKRNSSRFTM